MSAPLTGPHSSSTSSSGHVDGLGRRTLSFDRETGAIQERLHLRPELAAFEPLIRKRVAHLATLEDERFARPKGVERDHSNGEVIVLAEFITGSRMTDLLDTAADTAVPPGVDVALGYLLEALAGLSTLHNTSRVTHGLIDPSRTMLTAEGQVVFLDVAMGPAVEHLELSRDRLWSRFGVGAQPGSGVVRFDPSVDVTQVALTALMLILGRNLTPRDYPDALPTLLMEVIEVAQIRGTSGFASGLQRILQRSLPIPGRRAYETADEALVDVRQLVRREIGAEVCRQAVVDFVDNMEAAFSTAPDTSSSRAEVRSPAPSPRVPELDAFLDHVDTPEPSYEEEAPLATSSDVDDVDDGEEVELSLDSEDADHGNADHADRTDHADHAPHRASRREDREEVYDLPALDKLDTEDMADLALVESTLGLSARRAQQTRRFEPTAPAPVPPPPVREEVFVSPPPPPPPAPPKLEPVFVPPPPVIEAIPAARYEPPPAPIEPPAPLVVAAPPQALRAPEPEPIAAPPVAIAPIAPPVVEAPVIAPPVVLTPVTPVAPPVVEPPVLAAEPVRAPEPEAPPIAALAPSEMPAAAPEPASESDAAESEAEKTSGSWRRKKRQQQKSARARKDKLRSTTAPPPPPKPPVPAVADAAVAKPASPTGWLVSPQRAAAFEPPVPVAPPAPAPVARPVQQPVAPAVPSFAPRPVGPLPQPVFAPQTTAPVYGSPSVNTVIHPSPLTPPAPVAPAAHVPASQVKLKTTPPIGFTPPKKQTMPEPSPIHVPSERMGTMAPLGLGRPDTYEEALRGFPWQLAAVAVAVAVVAIIAGRTYLPGRTAIVGESGAQVSSAGPGASVPAPAEEEPETPIPAGRGRLVVTTEPAGIKVLVDRKPAGETPLRVDIPPGRHMLSFMTSGGEVIKSVRVVTGKVVTMEVPVFSGWVAIFAPVVLDVAENGKNIGTTEQNRLMLPPGRHELTVSNKELGYSSVHTVEIEPGGVKTVNIDAKGSVSLNAAPWAEVWLENQKLGDTPLVTQVPLGTREFVFKHPQHGERRVSATVKSNGSSPVSVDFLK